MSDVEARFMEQYYVEEILAHANSTNQANKTLSRVLAQIISNDGMTHIQCREPKLCSACNIPLRVDTKWLLEVP